MELILLYCLSYLLTCSSWVLLSEWWRVWFLWLINSPHPTPHPLDNPTFVLVPNTKRFNHIYVSIILCNVLKCNSALFLCCSVFTTLSVCFSSPDLICLLLFIDQILFSRWIVRSCLYKMSLVLAQMKLFRFFKINCLYSLSTRLLMKGQEKKPSPGPCVAVGSCTSGDSEQAYSSITLLCCKLYLTWKWFKLHLNQRLLHPEALCVLLWPSIWVLFSPYADGAKPHTITLFPSHSPPSH